MYDTRPKSMSVREQVAKIQELYPEAYSEIYMEGIVAEQRFQDSVRRQEKALARTKNGKNQKCWYIPFP
jgi:hypothetical protein